MHVVSTIVVFYDGRITAVSVVPASLAHRTSKKNPVITIGTLIEWATGQPVSDIADENYACVEGMSVKPAMRRSKILST